MRAVRVVATDLAESYRNGTSPHVGHAIRVADPHRQPLGRQGAPARSERDARTSRPQSRHALSDPKALARRLRAPRRTNAVTTACCSGCATAIPTTNRSAPRWPRSRSRHLPDRGRQCCQRAPRQGHRRMQGREGRRDPLAQRDPRALAHRDLEPPSHRGLQRPNRGPQPVRQEGQAGRARLHLLRALPAAGPSAHWWCHLAEAPITAKDQKPLSPLQRVGPLNTSPTRGETGEVASIRG